MGPPPIAGALAPSAGLARALPPPRDQPGPRPSASIRSPRSHPATAWHRRSALLKSHKLRTSQTAQFNIKEHRQSLFSMSARPGCSGHRQCPVPSPGPVRQRSEEPQHATRVPGTPPERGDLGVPDTLPLPRFLLSGQDPFPNSKSLRDPTLLPLPAIPLPARTRPLPAPPCVPPAGAAAPPGPPLQPRARSSREPRSAPRSALQHPRSRARSRVPSALPGVPLARVLLLSWAESIPHAQAQTPLKLSPRRSPARVPLAGKAGTPGPAALTSAPAPTAAPPPPCPRPSRGARRAGRPRRPRSEPPAAPQPRPRSRPRARAAAPVPALPPPPEPGGTRGGAWPGQVRGGRTARPVM